MIQNLFNTMTRITPEMTGNQHSCLSSNKIDQKCQARKLITYHFSCLFSFQTHGITSFARFQREEVSRSKQEARGLGTFPTGIYESWHPLLNFQVFFWLQITRQLLTKSTGSTASFEVHGKYNTNLIFIDNGAPLNTFRYTHTHVSLSQWHFCSTCQ
jgi:hypothetical protein